jgi:uncharacterized membrane protein (UPF0127 family)
MRRITVRGSRGIEWTIDEPTTRLERARGLRGRAPLPIAHGMFFGRCRSVHTFGMRAPIIVASLDRRLRVVSVRTMRPRRVLLPRRGVRHILECAASADVRPGDRFEVPARPERRRGEAPTALRPSRR